MTSYENMNSYTPGLNKRFPHFSTIILNISLHCANTQSSVFCKSFKSMQIRHGLRIKWKPCTRK